MLSYFGFCKKKQSDKGWTIFTTIKKYMDKGYKQDLSNLNKADNILGKNQLNSFFDEIYELLSELVVVDMVYAMQYNINRRLFCKDFMERPTRRNTKCLALQGRRKV